MKHSLKGYIVGAIAAATYGLNPLFALPLYADGMGADAVLFYRYLAAVPIMGAMAAFRGRSLALHRRELLPMLFVGILMASSSLLLFESYNFMDAGIASTLLFVYPLMVAVIMAVFFRERLAPVTVLCIVMALGGIAMLFKGSDGATLSIAGTVLVMASSLTYAGYIVAVNRAARGAHGEAYILSPCARGAAVRSEDCPDTGQQLCRACPLVYVGLRAGIGGASHGGVVYLHHGRYTVYRADAHGHTGRFGAGNGGGDRRVRVRRASYGA